MVYSVAEPGCLSRIRVFSIPDPGFGSRIRIPDPGVKKAPDLGVRIRIRNTGDIWREDIQKRMHPLTENI
jgi:hypothetical protein